MSFGRAVLKSESVRHLFPISTVIFFHVIISLMSTYRLMGNIDVRTYGCWDQLSTDPFISFFTRDGHVDDIVNANSFSPG